MKRRRHLRIAKWMLFLLGSLLAFLPLVPVVIGQRAAHQVDHMLQQITKNGDPTEIEQLTKPSIPDAQNAALVYEQAFAELQLSNEDEQLVADIIAKRVDIEDSAVYSQALGILSQNDRALTLVKQAATMTECSFTPDFSDGMHMTFPQLVPLRSCGRLIALSATMLSYQGKSEDALVACDTGFRLVASVDEADTIAQLLRHAHISIMFKVVENVLRTSNLSGNTCRYVANNITEIDLYSGYLDTLKAERVMGIQVYDSLINVTNPSKGLAAPSGSKESYDAREENGSRSFPATDAMLALVFARDEAVFLEFMATDIENASLTYREIRQLPTFDERFEKATQGLKLPIMSIALLSSRERFHMRRDESQVHLDLVRIALLLRAYKTENNAYPDSLAELAGAENCVFPDDPFSGKPYIYRRQGNGFILYSWGHDLQDNLGKRPAVRSNKDTSTQASPTPPKQSESDIVFESLL